MDSTLSVSKGCFVFKPERKKGKAGKGPSPDQLAGKLWYQAYKKCVSSVEETLEIIEDGVFSGIVEGLIDYINVFGSCQNKSLSEIPAATLLTGVNMPDHTSLFATLSKKVLLEASPHVATIWSRDCTSLKAAVERMCSELMFRSVKEDLEGTFDEDSDCDQEKILKPKFQRALCNLQHLAFWYEEKDCEQSPTKKRKRSKSVETRGQGKPLVVIIPDFESFPAKVLQDFILLLSSYQSRTPFVLVLGVATAVSAVHRSLPHHVSSCLRMKVFQSQPSTSYFNEVLEKVFFSTERSVHLGGKTFKLLMDVFLFHDFSVKGFVQGFKYCLSQHFLDKDWTILSCKPSELKTNVNKLTKNDVESLRKLPSVRKHIESLSAKTDKISWLKDDSFVKEEILKLLMDLHEYINAFFVTLRCLNLLTSDLPGAPLEKNLRSVYASAFSCDLNKSAELKQCMTLLSFLSCDELESKLKEVLLVVHEEVNKGAKQLKVVEKRLEELVGKFKNLWLPCPSTPTKTPRSPSKSPTKVGRSSPLKSPQKSPSKMLMNVSNRWQFKEKLKEMSTQDVKQSPYEQLRDEVLSFLSKEMFESFLPSPQSKTLHEVLFFDDVASVKSHIVGAPRLAVLRALKDPHFYLECECCKLANISDIHSSLPDVSIVYKLHLESGKLINMYDWLQSFLTIVNPDGGGAESEVDPKLQARFTRAVAELQFLGFIKSSTSKTDHVMRLTWC